MYNIMLYLFVILDNVLTVTSIIFIFTFKNGTWYHLA